MYHKINPGHQLKRGTNRTKVNCDENSFVEGGKISILQLHLKVRIKI